MGFTNSLDGSYILFLPSTRFRISTCEWLDDKDS